MSDEKNFDYSAYADASEAVKTAGGNMSATLSDLAKLAQEQLDCEAAVAAAQAALTRAQDRLKDVRERRLPEAMAGLELKDFTTESGLKITIENTVRASPPKSEREKAWAWLRANGHAALLKRKVMVEFGKGEDDAAQELVGGLLKEFETVTDETSVHPSTLSAFVKDQLAKGIEIPISTFGIFEQKVAKIKKPK